MNRFRLLAATAIAGLLAACQGEAPQEGEATGEVLEGTISDDMLPLDQVRSEAPLADRTGTGSGTARDAAASETADDESQAENEGEPAEEPSDSEE